MIGGIIGDVIGSPYEFKNINMTDFPLFKEESFYTDDTILSIAISQAVLNCKVYSKQQPTISHYTDKLLAYGIEYNSPKGDYGGYFRSWLNSDNHEAYSSYGNGSAMRVSSIGWLFDCEEKVIEQATLSLNMTYQYLNDNYADGNYNHSSCQDTVPQAIICFLESVDFEDSIRKAISIGGDSDTLACITGSIAEAYYKKINKKVLNNVYRLLPDSLFLDVSFFLKRYKTEQ